MNTYQMMAGEKMTPGLVQDLITGIFEVELDQDIRDLSTRKANQIRKFTKAVQSETNSHGKTVWGLFNAVTYFTNHMLRPKNTSKEDYLMDQRGFYINEEGFKILSRELVANAN